MPTEKHPMKTIHDHVREVVRDNEQAATEQGSRRLHLVSALCRALARYGIAYCHWKSNEAIHRSAAGENDLDLLISGEHATKFIEILACLGFKEAIDPPERQLPGVLSFYGLDEDTNRIVHVHAHFRLILGHDYTKNYHLPLEDAYLESAEQGELFRIPPPEFEFLIFVVRMTFKHCTWDTILIRHGHLSLSEKRELDYLEQRVRPDRLHEILRAHLPSVEKELLDRCADAIRAKFPVWRRVMLGRELQKRLAPYSRRPRVVDVCLKFWHRVVRPIRRRVIRNTPKARLGGGGLVIAVVGGDGAGKSTMVAELRDWLSKEFDTLTLHMGKPQWSFATYAIRGLLKIVRLGFSPSLRPIEYSLDSAKLEFPGYTWAIWEVCTARDRYLAVLKGRRFAANGGITICDRYPLPQVKLMDGPQVRRFAEATHNNKFIRLLSRAEERYYARITNADLLVVLRVDPALAVARKADENPSTVRPRSSEIWGLDWDQVGAQVVDASRPKNAILSELKAFVWSKL